MAHELQRCRSCGHFSRNDGPHCPACERAARRRAEPVRRGGWTYLGPRDCAWVLTQLAAFAAAIGLSLQLGTVELCPYWYAPPGEALASHWDHNLWVSISLGLPVGVVLASALIGLVGVMRSERGCWLPNAVFPLTGKWLKYLLTSLLGWVVVLAHVRIGPLGPVTILSLGGWLLLSATLWEAHSQRVFGGATAP